MKVLLLSSSFNGLCQRVHQELTLLNHTVSVEFSINADIMEKAVKQFKPDLIICPFLKERVPKSIWKNHACLIIHPGIEGDRGPSSLDWAVSSDLKEWGVTILQAIEEMDAGDIWGTQTFKLRDTSKASTYRREVTQHAIHLVKQAVINSDTPAFQAKALDYSDPSVKGRLNPLMKQSQRSIDWKADDTQAVCRKINAADSFPGVLDDFLDLPVYIYGARKETKLTGHAGKIIAYCDDGVCKATIDGAVWIRTAKLTQGPNNKRIKLPATQVLNIIAKEYKKNVRIPYIKSSVCKDIRWDIKNDVAYLYFDFYNGAMNTQQCKQLREAYKTIKKKSVKVITLMGGDDFWSNGIHLNCIEVAKEPGEESWRNIQAINNLIEEIILSPKHVTIAALRSNAGAGGAMMPLACDKVVMREGVVLNPHYATMGLHGSEYWTYLLPKRVGSKKAQSITEACMPMLATEAQFCGFADDILPEDWSSYHQEIQRYAESFAQIDLYKLTLQLKHKQRQSDEKLKRLQNYRKEELAKMRLSFFDNNSEYHQARKNFVYKEAPVETPERIAIHRQTKNPWQTLINISGF